MHYVHACGSSGGNGFQAVFANKRGLNDAAAVGIVEKVIAILFLVPSSMLQTVSALCAQNIGAGKHDRARLSYFASKFCLIQTQKLVNTV